MPRSTLGSIAEQGRGGDDGLFFEVAAEQVQEAAKHGRLPSISFPSS